MSGDWRRPRAGACVTCRSRKRRCIPTDTGDGCRLCHAIAKPCSLSINQHAQKPSQHGPAIKEHRRLSNASEGPLSVLASQQIWVELVHLYFRFIHDIPHTIFHEPTFFRRLNEGSANMIHVYAMCALAARFSNNPVFEGTSPCERGNAFITEAIRLCQPYMISPCLDTVQGFLLIAYYLSGEGNMDGKHVYIGLARLHAERLSINDHPSAVFQEEFRRSWLSILITGHWSAWDMSMEPRGLPDTPDIIPNIDDATFRTTSADLLTVSQVQDASRLDMWAQMAHSLEIFAKVTTLMRQLSHKMISFDEYCTRAAQVEADLDIWAANLPPKLSWNFDNLMFLAPRRLGQIYLAMHIGFFHFRQMLLFPFLHATASRYSRPDQATKCKESAAAVSSILQYSKTIKECDLNQFIYGHIGVVSSCVHLHTLLFSDDYRELSLARQRLVSNFQYLMTLKSLWPIVEHHTIHLRTFQNSCRDSISDPFVLDNWMARFLTEHTSLLSERQLEAEGRESSRKSASGIATPAVIPSLPTIEFLTTYQANDSNSAITGDDTPQLHDLSQLLRDQDMTGEALVDSALNWLLDDNDYRGQTISTWFI
ncbi:hypothetical protein BDV18DRAFT_158150 [Aspergillus unguis]